MSKKIDVQMAPRNFTVKAKVSVPDFQFEDNESEYFIKPTGPIVRGEDRTVEAPQAGGAASQPMQAPWKCRIIDLETGELVSALIPAMVRNHLAEAYPGDGYIGKEFRIVMHAARKPKKYRTADIDEIDWETGGETEVATG